MLIIPYQLTAAADMWIIFEASNKLLALDEMALQLGIE